jgi:hypothetical protein
MKKITFLGIDYEVKISRFNTNNRPALFLIDCSDGSPARISVNLPQIEMADNETAIKNYSENDGILEHLIKDGIVSEPVRFVDSGFVQVPICKILI